MEDNTTPAKVVPSPCTGICRMDTDNGWCEGCRRTLDEIASWSSLSDREKLTVWRQIGRRRKGPPEVMPPPS